MAENAGHVRPTSLFPMGGMNCGNTGRSLITSSDAIAEQDATAVESGGCMARHGCCLTLYAAEHPVPLPPLNQHRGPWSVPGETAVQLVLN